MREKLKMVKRIRFARVSRFAMTLAAAAIFFAMAGLQFEVRAGQSTPTHSGPVIDDWTHHRLMFSDPGRWRMR